MKMGILDSLVGIRKLEERVTKLERRVDILEKACLPKSERNKLQVIELLDEPKTTDEVAKMLGITRSWASKILNELEREGRVKELGKREKKDLYVRV